MNGAPEGKLKKLAQWGEWTAWIQRAGATYRSTESTKPVSGDAQTNMPK